MLYRIGEVSRLFGLTNETLRNYERAGIIHSQRVKGSGYRYYDIVNISKLIGIRARRNEGFSIKELEAVYRDTSFEQYRQIIRQKISAQEAEIALRQLRLTRLKQIDQFMHSIETQPNHCAMVVSPRLYLFPYRDGDLLNTANMPIERIARWTENMMLITNYVSYAQADGFCDNPSYEVALAATEAIANALALDLTIPVKTIEPVTCVKCCCERNRLSRPWAQSLPNILAFLKANRLTLSGDSFSLTLGGFHEVETQRTFIELYIPVEYLP